MKLRSNRMSEHEKSQSPCCGGMAWVVILPRRKGLRWLTHSLAYSPANRVLLAAHSEAQCGRTGFVQRASKITGKVFLALLTLGQWSAAKTSLAQLAAKAAQFWRTGRRVARSGSSSG